MVPEVNRGALGDGEREDAGKGEGTGGDVDGAGDSAGGGSEGADERAPCAGVMGCEEASWSKSSSSERSERSEPDDVASRSIVLLTVASIAS